MFDLVSLVTSNSFTKSEALRKLRALRELAVASTFGGKTNFEVSDEEKKWCEKSIQKITKEIKDTNIEEVFADAEERLKNLEDLIIYLPSQFPAEEVKKIGERVRKDHKPLLLEIKVDPELLAGAAFSYKGVYKDYSLKAKLEEERDHLREKIKKFLISH